MIEHLLRLLFPPKCVLCGRILPREQTDLCHACRAETPAFHRKGVKLRFIKEHTAVWFYEGHVRKSILRYKFRRARSYCHCYGRLLAMRVQQDLPEADVITWVPISRKRLKKRGYDQSRLLAEAMSRELGIPAEGLLEKRRENRAQSTVRTPEERRANVLGVYRVTDPQTLAGKDVLLVDDVITTGSTAGECARMLLSAGARNVYCAAVAAGRNQKH